MAFPQQVKDSVMVKCGRHCCICRRFRPTLLQIHHIQESSNGGSDCEENAIAVCVMCHIDVHTKRPFTQRFSQEEIIQHRELTYSLVASGKMAISEYLPSRLTTHPCRVEAAGYDQLSPLAWQLLAAAAEAESGITYIWSMTGKIYQAGEFSELITSDRRNAEFKAAVNELQRAALISSSHSDKGYEDWSLTLDGYRAADLSSTLVLVND